MTTGTEKSPIRLPADLRPEQVTAVVDTREQLSLDVSPSQTVTGTLTTGDYSIMGLENTVAIERKSLSDLVSCVGVERERFEREVQRPLAYPVRALVVEANWNDLERGEWRSKVTPQAAVGSALGWIASGLPVVMARDHGELAVTFDMADFAKVAKIMRPRRRRQVTPEQRERLKAMGFQEGAQPHAHVQHTAHRDASEDVPDEQHLPRQMPLSER